MKDLENGGTTLSRRAFLTGAALAAAGVAATGLAGCAKEDTPAWLPTTWDKEADIVVVGYGGAGAAATITAAQEGLGSVLLLEAGPEGEEGGNTRVSANLMFIPDDASAAVKYQAALNGAYVVEEDLLKGWADELVKNVKWMEGLGAKMVKMPLFSPEFPEVAGSEGCRTYCVDGTFGLESAWKVLKAQEEKLGLNVLYGTRALQLIHDPETKEVVGVSADQNGTTINIKAKKGVVLACGGFENDPEMIRTYYHSGVWDVHHLGTPYNRGDGFRMAGALGAAFWHMNNTAGTMFNVLGGWEDSRATTTPSFKAKDYIWIGPDGKRFMYEETAVVNRHGKINVNGCWVTLPTPMPTYAICGSKTWNAGPIVAKSIAGWLTIVQGGPKYADNQAMLDAGVFMKADTVADLAKLLKLNEATLKETIDTYNGYCAEGVDEDFGRGTAVYDQFSGMDPSLAQSTTEPTVVVKPFALEPLSPPFYVVPLTCSILNTQGGPKRSAKGEVLSINGKPIPRLFAAGEFGCEYSYMYNGGGNVSEALSSGRIAARSAAALTAWDTDSKA
ncbi:MAG: FAD-binding protein [Coriobacteriia bacterium]